MPAVTTNLTVERGATFAHGWRVRYGLTVATLAPIDATWTLQGMVRPRVESATVLHTWTGTVTADGDVIIGVSSAESSAWTWDRGVYDVEVTKTGTSPPLRLRVAKGRITVDPDVTRP